MQARERADGSSHENCTTFYPPLIGGGLYLRCSRERYCVSTNTQVLRLTSFHDWQFRPGQTLVVLVCLSLTAYFAHHALHGRHGLEARKKLMERSSLLDFEIRSLETVRTRLARDVSLLSPEMPDSDLVEEIARDVLGFVHPKDKVSSRPRAAL